MKEKEQGKGRGVPVRKASPSVSASKSSPKKAPGFPATPSRKKAQLPMGYSAQVFSAYALIDMGYYAIERAYAELSTPRSGFIAMIDAATGLMADQTKYLRDRIVENLRLVIQAKKVIRADASADERMLNVLLSRPAIAIAGGTPQPKARSKAGKRGPQASPK